MRITVKITQQPCVNGKRWPSKGKQMRRTSSGRCIARDGVPQDYSRARQWWEKAAAQGSVSAQSDLGQLYASGLGGSQDLARPTCGPVWRQEADTKSRPDTAMIWPNR
ncbi:MAG: sel1 repeat family protein [Nitrospira sp. CG24A]|nr:MAG: sel1 repeat family protein [Nitrospira sp. CG24A]